MRTLMRPGRRAALVRIEGSGGTRFVVRDRDSRKPNVLFDLGDAVRLFEDLESGVLLHVANEVAAREAIADD